MRQPALFVAHGAPPLLDDPGWVAELQAWARSLPRPRAILAVSAHWEARALTVGATQTVPLIYDFYGFPERFYRMSWPAPGAPELAARVRELARQAGVPVAEAPERGHDHGTWVPLKVMYPDADIPVLSIALPTLAPGPLLALGKMLAPLREEGVAIVANGFLTHNLRAVSWAGGPPPPWAVAFDAWVEATLRAGDMEALVDFERRAPQSRLAHPRTEHFVPLLVAAGAAGADPIRFPITGWTWGAFTKRSVQWG